MPGTPRTALEDTYTNNLNCAICGYAALSVAHMPKLPDYVACSNCGAAFVVEEGGDRVLYGKIPAGYPSTQKFALRQWAWIEAVARKAAPERPPPQATTPPIAPEREAPPPAMHQAASGKPLSQPTVPVAAPTPDSALPAPAGATPSPGPLADDGAPKYFAPAGRPSPPFERLDEAAAARARLLQASEDDDPLPAVPYLPGSKPATARPTPPGEPSPRSESPARSPQPASPPAQPAFGPPHAPAVERPAGPAAGTPTPLPAAPPAQAVPASPAAVAPAPPKPATPSAPAAPVLRPEDPPAGLRYRVVLMGRQVVMPSSNCAHCMRTPVQGRITVTARVGRTGRSSRRRKVRVSVPLCADCQRRATGLRPEQRSARLQGVLISAVVGLGAVLAGLALGLVDLGAEPVAGVLTLILLGFIGYAVPALIFLLGRGSRQPPPEDALYVRSTLIIPPDREGHATAFEWRNQGYAGLFSESNAGNVVGNVAPIRSEI